MKLRVVLALCGLSAFLLFAQEEQKEAPRGPQLDEMSKQLLTSWEKHTYHLGRLGVKKASCKVKVSMTHQMGAMEANLTYKWDGQKGTVSWDNPQMGAMLDQGGRISQALDGDFKHEPFEQRLSTAKCVAQATETGHVVTVEGKTKMGFKSLTFDKDGVLVGLSLEMASQMGSQKVKVKPAYTKVDGKYLVSSQRMDIESGMGQMDMANEYTYTKVGNYHVKQKQTSSMTMAGAQVFSRTMVFSDWKLNEAVDAPPQAKNPAGSEEDDEGEEEEDEDDDDRDDDDE